MVDSVKLLRGIKDQSDQFFTYTGKLLHYDQHVTLKLSAETGHYSQFEHASTRSTRKCYHNELGGIDVEIDSPSEVTEDLDCDTDTSATNSLENMTNRGNSNSNSYFTSYDYALLTPE